MALVFGGLEEIDEANKTVSFTYNDRNELQRRTWARGAYTDFTYQWADGALATKNLSSSTGVEETYTFTRVGNLASVVDNVSGTWSYAYNSNLQVEVETLPSGFYGSRILKREYHGTGGSMVAGAAKRFALGGASDPWAQNSSSVTEANYNFDGGTGRLSEIVSDYYTGSDPDFDYAYHANTNLVTTITSSTTSYKRTNLWADWRNVKDGVKTEWGTTTVANYVNGYDWVDRRTTETVTGTLLGSTGLDFSSPYEHSWAYDARGEVTTDTHKQNGATISAKSRSYEWDNAWNRTKMVPSAAATPHVQYTTNNLNQYSVLTGFNGVTPTGYTYPTYDFDGNMLSDGGWAYEYDSENRLVKMKTIVGTAKSLTFKYDYMGRRIEKKVFPNTTYSGTPTAWIKYAYDGWNMIAELNGNSGNAVIRSYVWGPDASQTMQGAGGVAGLLMIAEGGNRYYPVYDSENNVTGLLNGSGVIVAAYSYDAFGGITTQNGDYAGSNPFGFSTKYTDRESGLVYYGHRYYTPALGRFLNRDPIGVAGGSNLYAFVGNSPTNVWDVLGLYWVYYDYTYWDPGTLGSTTTGSNLTTKTARFWVPEDVEFFPEDLPEGFYVDSTGGGGDPPRDRKDCFVYDKVFLDGGKEVFTLPANDDDPGFSGQPMFVPAGVDADSHMGDANLMGPGLWALNVRTGGDWDYKNRTDLNQGGFADYAWMPYGNWEYGATGNNVSIVGFPLDTLLRNAGGVSLDARRDDRGDPGWGIRPFLFFGPTMYLFGGSAPFGDSRFDQAMITSGYEYGRKRKLGTEDDYVLVTRACNDAEWAAFQDAPRNP